MPATKPKKPAKKPAKKQHFTLKALNEAIYPALEEAGKAVQGGTNEIKLLVQEGAAEVQGAVNAYAERRISLEDLRAIAESWKQATASATVRESANVGENTVSHLKAMAGAALKALIG